MSKLNVNNIGPQRGKNITVDSDFIVSGSTIVNGPLIINNNLIFSGGGQFNGSIPNIKSESIESTKILSNVFSNPRKISNNIILSGETNSIIFGPDITINEGYEIIVSEDSNLLIFDPEDYLKNNCTYSGNTFTGNTSENPISGLWVAGDVHANAFYGDGNNLTEGYNTQQNGDLSKAIGINTIAGSKKYDFVIATKNENFLNLLENNTCNNEYYLILDKSAKNEFNSDNTKSYLLTVTGTTGTTTVTSTTVTFQNEILSGASGCDNYLIINNGNPIGYIPTFNYLNCDGSSGSTRSSTNLSICSLVVPTYNIIIPPPFSAYTSIIESGITIIKSGQCCTSIIRTSAITKNVVTTTTTNCFSIPTSNAGCGTSYEIINNTNQVIVVTYKSCNGTIKRGNFYPGRPPVRVCSSIYPSFRTPSNWNSPTPAISISTRGSCCPSYYITNLTPYTLSWSAYDCCKGQTTTIRLTPNGTTTASIFNFSTSTPIPFSPSQVNTLVIDSMQVGVPDRYFCEIPNTYTYSCVTTTSSYTQTNVSVTTACTNSTLFNTGNCVTYRFTNYNQTIPADDNVFWTDCYGINRSFKLNPIGLNPWGLPITCSPPYLDVCAIENSAYAISGIDITQIYSACCITTDQIYNINIIHHFSGGTYDGRLAWTDLFLDNGVLYGMTENGGTYDEGTLYSYNPSNGNYQILHNFDCSWQNANRTQDCCLPNPSGGLFKASNGKLYGLTNYYFDVNYTTHDGGSIFSYDTLTNQYNFLTFFDNTTGLFNGRYVGAALMEPSTDVGFLYGISYSSINSFNPNSVIYKYDILNNNIIELLNLGSLPSNFQGRNSVTQFFELSPGVLYGTCSVGGSFGHGIIFRYEILTGTYTVVHNFNRTNGEEPVFRKWAEKNGVLYGVTFNGGSNNIGIIFSYDPINGFNKLYDFCSDEARNPVSLMFGSDGKLYITGIGAAEQKSNGTCTPSSAAIFSFDIETKILKTLYNFRSNQNSLITTYSTLVEFNSKLYGTSRFGGDYNFGTLYEFNLPTTSCLSGQSASLNSIDSNSSVGIINIEKIFDFNAKLFDIENNEYKIEVLSIIEKSTNKNGSIINDEFFIGGLKENTEYTVLKIKSNEPIESDSGTIISSMLGGGSFASGFNTQSKGSNSHSEGIDTIASGDGSHTEGIGAVSLGIGSHAEGLNTIASGDYSHSEGNQTIANGEFSSAKGENTIANGKNSIAEGYGSSANGDLSNASGQGTTSGTKQYDLPEALNGKYLLFLDDVSDNFTTGKLKLVEKEKSIFEGTVITNSTEVTYNTQTVTGSSNGCIYYALANNTAFIGSFVYNDCETGLTARTTVSPYSISYICSISVPIGLKTNKMMQYFTYPLVVTPIGVCCEEVEITTATTVTTTTTVVTSAVTIPYASCGVRYERCSIEPGYGIIDRMSYGNHGRYTIIDLTVNGIQYGGIGDTLLLNPTNIQVGLGIDGNACVTNITDWLNGYLPESFTLWNDMNTIVKPVGSTFNFVIQFENLTTGLGNYTYTYSNSGWSIDDNSMYTYNCTTLPCFSCQTYYITDITQDLYYTSCTGVVRSLFLPAGTLSTTICAIAPPTLYGGIPLETAATVTLVSDDCCIRYNINNPAWCTIKIYYIDCFTGLNHNIDLNGYQSIDICSLTYPTFDTSCWAGQNPSTLYPVVTIVSNNSCRQYENVVLYSSVTTTTTYTITTGCTSEITYTTGLTGCINYIITNNLQNDPNGYGPLLVYTDCLGDYNSRTLVSGQTINICSSRPPLINVHPTLSAYTSYVSITPSGTCETLCVNNEFVKLYDTTLQAVWDVSYLDCDFNLQFVSLRRAGDSFETCMILGSETYGSNIRKYQRGGCSDPRSNRTTTVDRFGEDIIYSELVPSNGHIKNNSSTYPINVVNIFTGTTSGGTIIFSGASASYTGITGTTTTVTTGTTSTTATTITTGITSVQSGETICTAYTEVTVVTYETIFTTYVTGNTVFTGYTVVTGLTVNYGVIEVPCDDPLTGYTATTFTSGTTILTGSTVVTGTTIYSGITHYPIYFDITGVTIQSKYTIIELSEELPLNVSSGKITSDGFGFVSSANGILTQAKGTASVSQNMMTKSNGDYSHAEGYNTIANGVASHSEGINTTANGVASHAGGIGSVTNYTGEFAISNGKGVQYSIIVMNGFTSGSTLSILRNNDYSTNIKFNKNSFLSIDLHVSAVITKSESNPELSGFGFTTTYSTILPISLDSNCFGTVSLSSTNIPSYVGITYPQLSYGVGVYDEYGTIIFNIDNFGSGDWDLKWGAVLKINEIKF